MGFGVHHITCTYNQVKITFEVVLGKDGTDGVCPVGGNGGFVFGFQFLEQWF